MDDAQFRARVGELAAELAAQRAENARLLTEVSQRAQATRELMAQATAAAQRRSRTAPQPKERVGLGGWIMQGLLLALMAFSGLWAFSALVAGARTLLRI